MYYESIAEYKFQFDGLDNLDFDEAIVKHASHTSISLIKQSISTVVRLMKPTAVGFIRYGRRRSDRIGTARFVW